MMTTEEHKVTNQSQGSFENTPKNNTNNGIISRIFGSKKQNVIAKNEDDDNADDIFNETQEYHNPMLGINKEFFTNESL